MNLFFEEDGAFKVGTEMRFIVVHYVLNVGAPIRPAKLNYRQEKE